MKINYNKGEESEENEVMMFSNGNLISYLDLKLLPPENDDGQTYVFNKNDELEISDHKIMVVKKNKKFKDTIFSIDANDKFISIWKDREVIQRIQWFKGSTFIKEYNSTYFFTRTQNGKGLAFFNYLFLQSESIWIKETDDAFPNKSYDDENAKVIRNVFVFNKISGKPIKLLISFNKGYSMLCSLKKNFEFNVLQNITLNSSFITGISFYRKPIERFVTINKDNEITLFNVLDKKLQIVNTISTKKNICRGVWGLRNEIYVCGVDSNELDVYGTSFGDGSIFIKSKSIKLKKKGVLYFRGFQGHPFYEHLYFVVGYKDGSCSQLYNTHDTLIEKEIDFEFPEFIVDYMDESDDEEETEEKYKEKEKEKEKADEIIPKPNEINNKVYPQHQHVKKEISSNIGFANRYKEAVIQFQRNKYVSVSEFYWKNGFLDFFQSLLDENNPFFDGGRSNPFKKSYSKYTYTSPINREIILVDLENDKKLKNALYYCANSVFFPNSNSNTSAIDTIESIISTINQLFGGRDESIIEKTKKHVLEIQEKNKSNVVKLGDMLGFGVCRHRSIMFKLVCDSKKIKCRLIRGYLGTGGHAWNIVLINYEYYVADIMNSLKLIKLESFSFSNYKSIGTGSIGGDSMSNKEDYDFSTIKFGKKIGQGGFGSVYDIKIKNNINNKTEDLAMKIVSFESLGQYENFKKELNKEIYFMKFLKHPNLMKLKFEFEKKKKNEWIDNIEVDRCILMEKMDYNGKDLIYELRKFKIKERIVPELIFYFFNICVGVRYLHKLNIVHGDLKPHNILLNLDKKRELIKGVKITDFQTAKEIDLDTTSASILTWKYAAPEIIENNGIKRNESADIYSLGMIFDDYSMFYKDIEECREIFSLIKECTQQDREKRPSIDLVIYKLITVLLTLPDCTTPSN